MSSQKPLLCPWLITQVDSGQYPGLCWVNKEKRQFRIPWKHCLRQNISSDDVKIFEAWAIASGRYRAGVDVPNPPVWKRNFRSALARKKHFRRVQDNRSDPLDPHLIYEIHNSDLESGGSSGEEEEVKHADLDINHVTLPTPPNTAALESGLSGLTIFSQIPGASNQVPLDDGRLAPNTSCYSLFQAMPAASQNQANLTPLPVLGATAWAPQTPDEKPSATIPSTTEFKAQMKEYFPDRALATDFEVSIYYRGRKVRKEIVKNPNGFRLSYSSQSSFPYLQDVLFPDPATTLLCDQRQIKYTNKLLERVDQGLMLEIQHNQISAQRYGGCKVFWSVEQDPGSREPQEISNRSFTALHSLVKFSKELCDFVNSTGGSPQYTIWLCFGELWPDPDGRPWHKKMIMVRVVPVNFKLLHEVALGIGASSLRSDEMNLQFSDHLCTTSFLSVLEEYMDLS
ncbi:interferon regulatory factor 3-like isoform X3 [Hypanus sabinus]|uniref:interferon regulatory factor 3-like isoform X3 n=1 Tax=Hypanus sabinus TaxID=79690 RepID=UPI0028C48522|nr:interferon regulatory factor 3-like isoform X3 [Hypanus sabinus]